MSTAIGCAHRIDGLYGRNTAANKKSSPMTLESAAQAVTSTRNLAAGSTDLRRKRPLFGVGLVIAATLLFACHDATAKHLLSTYDVPLVSAIRYVGHMLLMLAILGPSQGASLVRTRRPVLVIIRSLCLVVATLFAGLALQRMPIAETTAIIYLAPILVVLLAGPILGETIGLAGWLAAAAGFVGVVLIVRPGGGLDTFGVIFALSNVGMTVAYYLLTRLLAGSERTIVLLFYSALVGAICFGVAAPWYWFDAAPGPLDTILFISLAFSAGIGHFCFTAANRYAEASLLAPMSYTHLIWAAVLGWIVFAQSPEGAGILGMILIGLAGLGTAVRSRFAVRRA